MNLTSSTKALFVTTSSYFRGALNCRFREAKTRTLTLPVEDKEGFRTFFNWVYTGKVYDTNHVVSLEVRGSVFPLFRGYVFADARGIPAIKNTIIDELMNLPCRDNIIPDENIIYVWENTTEPDGLRKLFLDWLTMVSLGPTFFDNRGHLYPKDLLWSMVVATMAKDPKPPARSREGWMKHKCDYHDHFDVNQERPPMNNNTEVKKET